MDVAMPQCGDVLMTKGIHKVVENTGISIKIITKLTNLIK